MNFRQKIVVKNKHSHDTYTVCKYVLQNSHECTYIRIKNIPTINYDSTYIFYNNRKGDLKLTN